MRTLLAVWLSMGVAAGSAEAATCAFDAGTGVLTVELVGTDAELKANATGILLDGAPCGAATKTSTSRIVVNGNGVGRDSLRLHGKFAPGRNDVPESDTPEIEIDLVGGWSGSDDDLWISGTAQADAWRLAAGEINLNGDLDSDLDLPSAGQIHLKGLAGNDVIDASGYAGGAALWIVGGTGDDLLTGDAGANNIRGGDGDDTLFGRGGNDHLDDGPGADLLRGGNGNDWMETTTADAADDFRGGEGDDAVSYAGRQTGVTVTIDDLADDGEPGELTTCTWTWKGSSGAKEMTSWSVRAPTTGWVAAAALTSCTAALATTPLPASASTSVVPAWRSATAATTT